MNRFMKLIIICFMIGIITVATGILANIGHDSEASIQVLELQVDGTPWAWLVHTSYDPQNHEGTYKPFVHLLDPESFNPITKGAGGFDSHHRGMYIGWNEVYAEGSVYDFWHMNDGVSQRHIEWIPVDRYEEGTFKRQKIHWCDPDGTPLIEEIRTIGVRPGPDQIRLFDFTSELTSQAGLIKLRGDLHHAGMHVRLANEVFWTQWRTRYIFPEGVTRQFNARVPDTWWVCCSAVVNGRRHYVLHMTHPDNQVDMPTYSARQYARFGSFFESDLEPEQPLVYRFRIALSMGPIDTETCERLYSDFKESIHLERPSLVE